MEPEQHTTCVEGLHLKFETGTTEAERTPGIYSPRCFVFNVSELEAPSCLLKGRSSFTSPGVYDGYSGAGSEAWGSDLGGPRSSFANNWEIEVIQYGVL